MGLGAVKKLFSHASRASPGMALLVSQWTALVQTEISQQLSDGLPGNSVQTFLVPRTCTITGLVLR